MKMKGKDGKENEEEDKKDYEKECRKRMMQEYCMNEDAEDG